MGWIASFWSKVDVKGKDECWLWKGCVHKLRGGYGVFRTTAINGINKLYKSHRLSYALTVGMPGDQILHHCDNPPCVNPFHLYSGNYADNVRDMDMRCRRVVAIPYPHPRAKLTPEQVKEIFLSKEGSIKLCIKYSVDRHAISNIRTGKTWTEITTKL